MIYIQFLPVVLC